jgi:ankyrin repeat protein
MDLEADVDQSSRGDGNPLIMAAMTNNVAIAQQLLDYGADVNAVVVGDETPLIYASRRGSIEMVELLVAHGADVNLKVKTGMSDGGVVRSPLNMARTQAVKDFLIAQGATP